MVPAFLGDTWEWDGTRWWPFVFAAIPARRQHAMAYDSQRNRTVLFGGGGDPTGTLLLGDTWEWDGANWANVTPATPQPSPSARSGHAMSYHVPSAGTVLFSGYNGAYANDTWTWNGTRWLQVATSGPQGRYLHRMAYHDQLRRTLLYGGEIGGGALTDTWEWNGSSWRDTGASGPYRWAFGFAHDSRRKKTVLYGGNIPNTWYEDVWEFDVVGASSTQFGSGCGLTLGGPATAPPAIGTTAQEPVTGIRPEDLFVVMTFGWSRQWFAGSIPLPFPLFPHLAVGCDLLVSADSHGPVLPAAGAPVTFRLAIPDDTSLLDQTVFLQAWTLTDQTITPIVSNGVEWVVGCP